MNVPLKFKRLEKLLNVIITVATHKIFIEVT